MNVFQLLQFEFNMSKKIRIAYFAVFPLHKDYEYGLIMI